MTRLPWSRGAPEDSYEDTISSLDPDTVKWLDDLRISIDSEGPYEFDGASATVADEPTRPALPAVSSNGSRDDQAPSPALRHPPSSGAGMISPDPDDDAVSQAVLATIERAAADVESIAGDLSRASVWAERTRAMQHTESEIGRLLLAAQAVADEAIAEAQALAAEIVAEAEAEAERMLAEAGHGDQLPVRGAQVPTPTVEPTAAVALSPDDAHALSDALQSFARTNAELVDEVALLARSLAGDHTDREVPGS